MHSLKVCPVDNSSTANADSAQIAKSDFVTATSKPYVAAALFKRVTLEALCGDAGRLQATWT